MGSKVDLRKVSTNVPKLPQRVLASRNTEENQAVCSDSGVEVCAIHTRHIGMARLPCHAPTAKPCLLQGRGRSHGARERTGRTQQPAITHEGGTLDGIVSVPPGV